MLIAALLMNEWIKRLWCVYTHTHTGMLFSHEKNKNLPFAKIWMDLDSIMLNEISLKEEDRYHMISLVCVILKKKKKFIDTENWLVVIVARDVACRVGKRVKVSKGTNLQS